jgi:hypothetical protein
MELDLQSLFGLHVNSCTHWLRSRNRPPPSIWALLVITDKRHLFVILCFYIWQIQCSGMFIPDPWSEFFPSRIPDPHQRI